MPATSQQQQKLFGLALSVKRGDTPRSEVSDEVLQIVDTMSEKKIKDFAETSHKGLPTKIETFIRGMVRETFRNKVLGENTSLAKFSKLLDTYIDNPSKTVNIKDLGKSFKKIDDLNQKKAVKLLKDKADYILDDDEFYSNAGWPVFVESLVRETFRNKVLGEAVDTKNIGVDTILNFKDGEVWRVTRVIGNTSNPRGFFAKPHDEKTKKANTSIEIELKPDFLQKNLKSINEVTRRSKDFFEDDNKYGIDLYKLMRGKWDRNKALQYFIKLQSSTKDKYQNILYFIASGLGINGRSYKSTVDLRDDIISAAENLYKLHNESVNEAKVKPKNEMGVRLVKAINNNIGSIYDLVFSQKKDVTHIVKSFEAPLLNSIKETIKYKYNPHPTTKLDKIHGGKSNEEMIEIFQTELKKFLPLVEKMIKTPTKVEVKKVIDAWRNIWNFKFGAKIGLSGDLHNSIIEQVEQLDEKLIVYSNRAPYGQVVFIAGGAASGKGFAVSNFLDSASFKVRDVDEMKKQLQKLNAIGKLSIQQITDKFGKNITPAEMEVIQKIQSDGYDLKSMDLKNPNHVYALHILVGAMGIKDQTLVNMLGAASNPNVLPNIMFDITAKKIADITEVLPQLEAVGYKPNNIHLVWILTNYDIALKANKERDRVVPYGIDGSEDVMLKTHMGAGNTIWGLVTKALPKGMDGRVDVILNNRENTINIKDKKTGEDILVQPRGKKSAQPVVKGFLSLPVKKQGGGILPEKLWKDILYNWIKDNGPKELTANM